MNPNVSINFTYETNLPQQVSGNLEKFKLAILTALEFSIKYCSHGVINVKVDFDSLSDNRETFMVSFTICMQLNRVYNEKPLMDFLNEHSKKRDLVGSKQKDDDDKSTFIHKNTMSFSDDFSSRHRIFCELTNNFGIGLIILPSILWQLGGWCSAVYRKGSNARDNLSGEPSSSYLALH